MSKFEALFGSLGKQWDNVSMSRYLSVPAILLAFGIGTSCISQAQQGTSASGQPSTSTRKSTSGTATRSRTAAPLNLTTEKAKNSYAIGLNIGNSLHRQSVDVDPAILNRGIRDALTGARPLLTDAEVQATLTALQGQMRAAMEQKLTLETAENKKGGEDFRVANRSKPGVVELPSGLQYKILKEGTGPKPKPTDMVVCDYRGMLINGKEFDSSYKRGTPAIIQVGRVIKGFGEALQLMPVGSEWELYIPPDLGYGDRQAGPDIGPGSTLIFDVKLDSIKPPNPAMPFALPSGTPNHPAGAPPAPQSSSPAPTTTKPAGTP
jgi:FKBP-type peptidyl-prolyl cis-trans isomerase FklB